MSPGPAELIVTPVQLMLDKGVARSTTAAALCQRLEGKCFAVQAGASGLDIYFVVRSGQLLVQAGQVEDADATISGSPLSLARLTGSDPEAAIRDGHVSISGDADVATDFRALLNIARPDWEEELSRITGDAIAHEAGRALKGFAGWAARTRHSLGRSMAEYLTEESRDLVAAAELQEFCQDVDELAGAVDRCAARLALLREQSARS
jgi:ubiquinone biosynthesis protein UbiJ